MTRPDPFSTRFVIVGAGFAGAATAWALSRLGEGPGVILEREAAPGVHASGRNAGLLKLSEDDAVVRALAVRTAGVVKSLPVRDVPFVAPSGGLALGAASLAPSFEHLRDELRRDRVEVDLLSADTARARWPVLAGVKFEAALWSPGEGIVDVHALLTHYLRESRAAGFELRTNHAVHDLLVEGGRVVGVQTNAGAIRAEVVVDAGGAWAGHLGRGGQPLPLQPLRRHLFVSGPVKGTTPALPFVWVEDAAFYFRPEGDGLLLSPCDQTPAPPGVPSVDAAAAELLAEKLARHAPGFGNLAVRKSWACLRTFAPDHRPIIGADPGLPGLFHVSGLGGFGVMTSAAVGELAAAALTNRRPDWIDPAPTGPARLHPQTGVRTRRE